MRTVDTNVSYTEEEFKLLQRYSQLGSRSNRLYCRGESTVEVEAEMDRVEAELIERGLL